MKTSISDLFIFADRIILSVILGTLIGFEREYRGGHEAGIRTFAFISMGSCLFGLLSAHIGDGDPSRIAAQIVSGIGFLGGGMIIKDGNSIRGLTTAAMVWCASAIGLSVAFEFYIIAIFTTLVGIVLSLVPHLTHKINNDHKNKN